MTDLVEHYRTYPMVEKCNNNNNNNSNSNSDNGDDDNNCNHKSNNDF